MQRYDFYFGKAKDFLCFTTYFENYRKEPTTAKMTQVTVIQ